jgi:F-type H+-transporting ATPase subunit epsilon
MESALRLEIVTPIRLIYKGDVDEVIAPGLYGELGILVDHAPLLTALAMGELIYKSGSHPDYAFIEFGFLEVRNNIITIIAENAELGREIDYERAFKEKEEAEKELLKAREIDDKAIRDAEYKLKKELMRIRISERYR